MASFMEAVQLGLMALELPFMVGGTGFLIWEMINKLRDKDD
jgi:tRNA A37 N6-isopentenylltransferase MiaA